MVETERRGCAVLLAFILVLAPTFGWGQSTAPAPLAPAAQEALDKGIIAAKVPDYLLAIRYFEEARKAAPQAPVVFLNLGLAESRIPSRELRAMAWFGAYLSAYPDAPNAAAVKEEITVLGARNHKNLSRLIAHVQDTANQIPGTERQRVFGISTVVMKLWASIGNYAAALQYADSFQDPYYRNWLQRDVAVEQAKAGDLAGARQTFATALQTLELIKEDKEKQTALHQFASTQAQAGDIEGAIQTADRVMHPSQKYNPQSAIAMAQAELGDSAGARQTLAKLGETANRAGSPWKEYYREHVAKVEARIYARNTATSGHQSASIAPSVAAAVSVSDWLKILNDDNEKNDCPLKSRLFLDLAAHLKSLPPADNPQSQLESLRKTVDTIVKAQNVINETLKRQARP